MTARERLVALREAWQREQAASRGRFEAMRRERTLAERTASGIALRALSLEETDAVAGGRLRLWLTPSKGDALDLLRISPGDPVLLWRESPDAADTVRGVFARRQGKRIAVVLAGDMPEWMEEGHCHLDLDDPDETFQRGFQAIEAFLSAKGGTPTARLREILFGGTPPHFASPPTLHFFDPSLNEVQREGVAFAMSAHDLALLHGPPGTGKTTVLVEVIRQAVHQGMRVLATAASNTAVDNLAERLVEVGLSPLRVGHPARVSPVMEHATLDARLEAHPAFKTARTWIAEANALRRRIERRARRGGITGAQKRESYREAARLERDARRHLENAQKAIVAGASVICATAAGSDFSLLRGETFDLVVLDEATQATDPIALIPLSRGARAVLAGDPCQLPPTVLAGGAARDGLSSTLFERLAPTGGLCKMLTVQYRMNREIMAFPSQSKYGGKLTAAPAVAAHRLEGLLGVSPDPLRPSPLIFLDTAGKGWEEVRQGEDPSTCNPAQAERTVAEVRRLLSRGLSPRDLAVITPYDAQVRLLRRACASEVEAGLEIGSIDGFQGREKEAVILDMVRANDRGELGFLTDTRRMNVALTRARRFLLVIGDSATLGRHPYYEAFLDTVGAQGGWISAWNDDAPPIDSDPSG
ncbi:MAG: AAA family ATPase [Deltaproteobacteria bacterium]|nr:MAG: AAA family ATPase [Deltaproteobacteria bacterium]